MARFIQWNCRGAKPNFNEIQLLLNSLNPVALCLQETYLLDPLSFDRHYTTLIKQAHITGARPHGGVSILVNNSVPHSPIQLITNLQAVAVRITAHKVITVCSLYLPPGSPVDMNDLTDLLNQL